MTDYFDNNFDAIEYVLLNNQNDKVSFFFNEYTLFGLFINDSFFTSTSHQLIDPILYICHSSSHFWDLNRTEYQAYWLTTWLTLKSRWFLGKHSFIILIRLVSLSFYLGNYKDFYFLCP